jgi:hypothetical protein
MSFQTSRPRMPVRIAGNPEAIFVPAKSNEKGLRRRWGMLPLGMGEERG